MDCSIFLGYSKGRKGPVIILLFFAGQLPACTYVTLLDDFVFGHFLVLEWYWIWLASNELCVRLELHMQFAAGPLPTFAFKYGCVLLKDSEQFILLGHSAVCTFLGHYCLGTVFLIGCLFETWFCLEYLLFCIVT